MGKRDNQVQEHLDYLTNHIGPRLTSSSNLTRACQWAAAQFRSWGLDARIEQWGTFPVGFDRGVQVGGMSSPDDQRTVLHRDATGAYDCGCQCGPASEASCDTLTLYADDTCEDPLIDLSLTEECTDFFSQPGPINAAVEPVDCTDTGSRNTPEPLEFDQTPTEVDPVTLCCR